MALIWQKRSAGKVYEVRTAGSSVRLYTDGIFHSQYNERRPISGNLWDMLALPLYLHSVPTKVKRILVLGVGGGAVIRHAMRLAPDAQIEAVDLDKQHLYVAKRFFKVTESTVNLHHADAISWVTQYAGPPFDVIIDDLFGESLDDQHLPQRAVSVSNEWLHSLKSILVADGVLAFNLESQAEAKVLQRKVRAQESLEFKQQVQISSPHYENVIALLHSRTISKSALLRALEVEPVYRSWLKRQSMIYRFALYFC